MRILLVEDNDQLRASLVRGLSGVGFQVDAAADGEAGWQQAAAAEHDLIVLDRMLPGLDGLELLRRLRRSGSAVPVLLLTARDTVQDRVEGLDAGADDYLVKPFAVAELLARIRALGRRGANRADPVVAVGGLEIDTAARVVRRNGRRIELTPREFALLEYLLAQPGAVVSRLELHEKLYGRDEDPASNAVEVLVARLRRKLHQPGAETLIHTRRGFGYQLVAST